MPQPSLTPSLFAIFTHLIEEHCGVHHRPEDRTILASKLEAHAFELGHDDLLDYYYRLRYDDPDGLELHKLVEAILVCETYFFRELAPLIQLVDDPLTEIVRTRGRARVWSAACSTGEEPFTLAMLLAERGLLDKVEIIASDVSATAIAHAQGGWFGERALRDGHPVALAQRYLEGNRQRFTVVPRIREAVRFEVVNLLDDAAVRGLGQFDAIVCRNVLIYFHEDQIVRVVDRLTRALAPTGLIAVGVAESLFRFGTALICQQRGGAFFYRSAR